MTSATVRTLPEEFRLPSPVYFEPLEDGRIVVMDASSGTYFILNTTAAFLFTKLLECRTLAGVLEAAQAVFTDTDVQELAHDIERLVDALVKQRLIERC